MSFSTCSLPIYWTSGMNMMVATTALSPPTGDRGRSWYKLAQVFRQWRHLILESSNCLGLHYVCTILAYSSPFPLIIYLEKDREMTTEDKESILIALGPEYRDRVRHIGLWMPASSSPKLLRAVDDMLTRVCQSREVKFLHG